MLALISCVEEVELALTVEFLSSLGTTKSINISSEIYLNFKDFVQALKLEQSFVPVNAVKIEKIFLHCRTVRGLSNTIEDSVCKIIHDEMNINDLIPFVTALRTNLVSKFPEKII